MVGVLRAGGLAHLLRRVAPEVDFLRLLAQDNFFGHALGTLHALLLFKFDFLPQLVHVRLLFVDIVQTVEVLETLLDAFLYEVVSGLERLGLEAVTLDLVNLLHPYPGPPLHEAIFSLRYEPLHEQLLVVFKLTQLAIGQLAFRDQIQVHFNLIWIVF